MPPLAFASVNQTNADSQAQQHYEHRKPFYALYLLARQPEILPTRHAMSLMLQSL